MEPGEGTDHPADEIAIRILDKAEDDLVEGYFFYEGQHAGLGDYFLECLFSDIDSLRGTAGIHRKAHRAFHRLLSKRFPFGIYYDFAGGIVSIYAVVDCRRKPAWIRRHLS